MTEITEATTPSRTERRRAATRAQLVAAAQDLLAEEGTAFSVQQAADRADLALATLYNHFPSKHELVTTAAMEAAATVETYLQAATSGIDDPLARLALRGRLHGRLLETHPREARVLLATALEVAAEESPMRAETLRLAHEVAESRGIPADDVLLIGQMAFATNQHLMAHQLADPRHGTDDVVRLVAMLMRMAGLTEKQAAKLAYGPLPA